MNFLLESKELTLPALRARLSQINLRPISLGLRLIRPPADSGGLWRSLGLPAPAPPRRGYAPEGRAYPPGRSPYGAEASPEGAKILVGIV